jgi:sodium/pantothenate symporter
MIEHRCVANLRRNLHYFRHGVTGPDATWQTPAEALTWAIILGAAWSVVVAVSPWQASRYLMARNEQTVLRAACGASAALLFMYPVLMLCGAAINLGNPDIEPADTAMIWAAQNMIPTLAGVLLMSGVMAAALSSATTFLSLVGFSASNDVMQHAGIDERKLLRSSRFCMFGIGVLALMLAFFLPPRIFWITYFAATVFASSWGPVAFMSVWSRKITADAAFWGIVVGFIGNIAAKALSYFGFVALPVWADPIILGAAMSTLAIVFVSRRGVVSEAEQRYRNMLHEVPAAELDPQELRRTRRWPVLLIVAGIALSALMVGFWALPYRAATASAGMLTGEVWVSLGCGFVLVAGGWVLHRHVRDA